VSDRSARVSACARDLTPHLHPLHGALRRPVTWPDSNGDCGGLGFVDVASGVLSSDTPLGAAASPRSKEHDAFIDRLHTPNIYGGCAGCAMVLQKCKTCVCVPPQPELLDTVAQQKKHRSQLDKSWWYHVPALKFVARAHLIVVECALRKNHSVKARIIRQKKLERHKSSECPFHGSRRQFIVS
jgi:hypothetical protein